MAPPACRKGEKPLGGNRAVCGALPCPPAPIPEAARSGGGVATRSSADSRKRPGTWSTPPGGRSEGVSGSSSLSLEPPVSVTASPLTCIQVHSPTTRLGSAPLFLVQQPIAKGQQCALRGRGGGGDAPPRPRRRARDAGPGRGGHCKLKVRGHIAENPDRAALRPFCQLGFSFGFPITLRCCKQQK